MKEQIPTIDLKEIVEKYIESETITEQFLKDRKVLEKSQELLQILNTWGFFYLTGHEIPEENINNVFQITRNFYELPFEEKQAAAPTKSEGGYVSQGYETFHPDRPADVKEAFDYTPSMKNTFVNIVPKGFTESLDDLYFKTSKLAYLLLRLITLALNIDDREYLERSHSNMKSGHTTVIRPLYYPALQLKDIAPNQGRCGEHTDKGTLTLLYQDLTGGLEVKSPTGDYISTIPKNGTILVNSADLLERWSTGRIKSTPHRVVMKNPTKVRQSMVMFVRPDQDVTVRCLDGSDKYPPINALDHVIKTNNDLYTNHKFRYQNVAGLAK